MIINIKSGDGLCGLAVLKVLHKLSLSGRMIKFLKYRVDGLTVNGKRVTVRYILKDGDTLSLAIEDTEAGASATPSDIPLDIVYEDSEIVVVNKPPFMPTHPSHGHHGDTLADALAGYYARQSIPFVFRPTNRLDKNTSGLVIAAKNKASAGLMTKYMQERSIKKTYIALLDGALPEPEITVEYGEMTLGVIDLPIHRTEKSIIVREVCQPDAPDAEEALTYYRILEKNDHHTKVEIFPQTGRTHQLRVHFASLGHPITGDDLYGEESEAISRHALHATSLVLPKPAPAGFESNDAELLYLTAPLPEDMARAEETFFGGKD